MNCLFNNLKSSRFFPRLHDKEGGGVGLDCIRDTGGIYWVSTVQGLCCMKGLQFGDYRVTKGDRLNILSLFYRPYILLWE